MNTTLKIARYELRDVLRSRSLFAYALFFFLVTETLRRFAGGAKAALSLMNVVLLLIPLVSIVFGTIYLYHAREFTEMLLAQPVRRTQLFVGQFIGLAVPLTAAFPLGFGAPFTMHATDAGTLGTLLMIGACGVALTVVFTALAALVVARVDDRVKGVGSAIGLWLALTIVYDGLVMMGLVVLADYPVEPAALVAIVANPIDLARVLILLRLDISALMGYTGAVFQQFFGGSVGIAVASFALLLWAGAPLVLGARYFRKKDF
jgi:Cu-processing system permease protein